MSDKFIDRRFFLKTVPLITVPSIISSENVSAFSKESTEEVFYKGKQVNVIPSNATSREDIDLFRDRPSVLDYDGVYNDLSKDSFQGLQKAFDTERELVMPRDFRCMVSSPLIIKKRGLHLYGGSKVATQIHPRHDGNVIEVGDRSDPQAPSPRCVLENFSILGNGRQTGGIILWDKKTNSWADASKGCRLSNLLINGIGNGPMLRIRSWGNLIEHVETVQGCKYGIILEQQALTNTFIHPYITGCSKEGIIIGDDVERVETCNTTFIGAIVQQCGGSGGSGAIVIKGACSTSFYDLYLERNGEKGAGYDIDITELAELTEIRSVTSRGAVDKSLILDKGLDTIVKNVWRFGSLASMVERKGDIVTGEYGGLFLKAGKYKDSIVNDLAGEKSKGRFSLSNQGVQIQNTLLRSKDINGRYTIPADGLESGNVYHVNSDSIVVLPDGGKEGIYFDLAISSGNSKVTLSILCETQATVNGLKSITLFDSKLYRVICIKNPDGKSSRWMVNT